MLLTRESIAMRESVARRWRGYVHFSTYGIYNLAYSSSDLLFPGARMGGDGSKLKHRPAGDALPVKLVTTLPRPTPKECMQPV